MKLLILSLLLLISTDPREIAKVNSLKKEAEKAFLEGNFKLLVKMGIHQEIIDFLNSQARVFQSFSEDAYFFPDNEDLDRHLVSHISDRS